MFCHFNIVHFCQSGQTKWAWFQNFVRRLLTGMVSVNYLSPEKQCTRRGQSEDRKKENCLFWKRDMCVCCRHTHKHTHTQYTITFQQLFGCRNMKLWYPKIVFNFAPNIRKHSFFCCCYATYKIAPLCTCVWMRNMSKTYITSLRGFSLHFWTCSVCCARIMISTRVCTFFVSLVMKC